jgi:enoyl-CoA hydratase
MSWGVEVQTNAVVVTMRSNPVNKMNPAFFDDLHAALDLVEKEHPALPMVLTAQGNTFSAGLDFEDVFPRFAAGDMTKLYPWFERFRDSILRVFTLPRRVVGAINGNAFAGGLILAMGCDLRIAAEGRARFAINEVPVGIPMPAVFTEIVRYAVGSPVTARAILDGDIYDVARAHQLGFLHCVVPPEQLLEAALAAARVIHPDSNTAYAHSKRVLQAPTLRAMDDALDRQALEVCMAPDSVRAQQTALSRLKKKS